MDLILFVFSVPRKGRTNEEDPVVLFTTKIVSLLYHGDYGLASYFIACEKTDFGKRLAEVFKVLFIEKFHLSDTDHDMPTMEFSGIKELWQVIDFAKEQNHRPVIFIEPAPDRVEIVREFLSVRRLAGFELVGGKEVPPTSEWQLVLFDLKRRKVEFLRDE